MRVRIAVVVHRTIRAAARLCLAANLLACLAPPLATARQPEVKQPEVQQPGSREGLDHAFRQQLELLAVKCDELKLAAQAATTRAWFVVRDPQRQYIFLPPLEGSQADQAGAGDAASDDPSPEQARLVQLWRRKFLDLRSDRARALFQLAGDQLTAGSSDQAWQLLHEVLREDPDHAEARRILGYRRVGGRWQKPEREVRTRSGDRNHPQFGWQRRRYWIVESEHYQIHTNHGSQAGSQLADELERLVDVWQQAFFSYWSDGDALRQRFAGQDVPLAPKRRFQVVLFRDHQEYLTQLGRTEPQIAKTLGYYLARQRTAYFHAGDESVRSTWLHEATHQLFQETATAAVSDPGESGNFWIVEGAALYMESLRPRDDYCTLGGWDARRLQFARYRTLNERFQMPLRELVGLGRQRLQQDEDIRRLYSQAAGLTHFLLDGQRGAYRAAVVAYLRDVYRGQAPADSLFTHIGQSAEQLDAQYRRYLDVSDQDLAFLDRPNELTDLCLGHTQVTDAGLVVLADASKLRWLDLSFTKVTDATIARISAAAQLRQLNLERTAISDAALETVGKLLALEELDLSQTAVTDAGLPRLSPLRQLSVLWLTGTQVSDEGLPHLYPLKQLETLDISRSKVTQQGWQQLQQQLPGVK